jgi:hypothetical protein
MDSGSGVGSAATQKFSPHQEDCETVVSREWNGQIFLWPPSSPGSHDTIELNPPRRIASQQPCDRNRGESHHRSYSVGLDARGDPGSAAPSFNLGDFNLNFDQEMWIHGEGAVAVWRNILMGIEVQGNR